MGNRVKKALQALGLILAITVACLAFMPWQMRDVVESLDETDKAIILRYDRKYSIAYPDEEELEELVDTLTQSTGHFDRAREQLSYRGEGPIYRIYLWTPEERIPDIWVCESAFFYDGSQYVLNDDDASALNAVLASCFS